MAISDRPQCNSVSSIENVLTLAAQPEIFVWFLNPPGLPLSVLTAAVTRLQPKLPILILSDDSGVSEDGLQTVHAIGTVSDEPPFLLPTLQSFLNLEPVALMRASKHFLQNEELGHDRGSVLDDLKSVVDSFPPDAKRHVIAEIRTILVEIEQRAA